jgi:hypothetical protein
MHSLVLFDIEQRQIPTEALERVFQSKPGFKDVRRNTPMGTPIEADFSEGEDFTMVILNEKRDAIYIRGTSGAALSAAWILKSQLDIPLRMVDTDYSFDLVISEFSTRDELERAIDRSRSD